MVDHVTSVSAPVLCTSNVITTWPRSDIAVCGTYQLRLPARGTPDPRTEVGTLGIELEKGPNGLMSPPFGLYG